MRALDAASAQWNRVLSTVLISRPESQRPLPAARIAMGRSISGGGLHVMVGMVALLGTAVLATEPAQWFFALVAVLVVVARPMSGLPQVYAGLLGVGLAIGPAHSWAARGFLLVLVLHLLVVLGSIADDVPWSARIEVAVLAAPARRFMAIQLFAQALAVGAAWVADRQVNALWVGALAGMGIAAVAWSFVSGAASKL
jgi:hypothetical protein